jgi:hypothetical protein
MADSGKGARMATRLRDEKRVTWQFVVTENHAWTWQKIQPDGAMEECPRRFTSLDECARDAGERGYGAWKQDERRRLPVSTDALAFVE